ncbi:MAG: hypothetical protein U5L02_08325 [Rheinheimera sp.]|nr:hypothetical protein [Rheinheimera sp.]
MKKQMLCSLTLSILAVALPLTAFANANSTLGQQLVPAEPGHAMQARWQTDAYRLGISVEVFKSALDNYMRLVFDNFQPAIPLLSDVTDGVATEAQLQQIMNKQRAEFANYLGIPVEILNEFEMLMPAYMPELTLPEIQPSGDKDKKVERIQVTCKDACANKGNSWRDTLLLLEIYQSATKAGIGQYSEFPVLMVGKDGSSLRSAVFKYNNYSGAWFVRDLPRCSTCSHD